MHRIIPLALAAFLWTTAAQAGTIEFGNENVLNTGTYPTNPKNGATLEGLAPGVVTNSTVTLGHAFPFGPNLGDFLGTDQIYVGSVQTGAHDGYSGAASRIRGPQIVTLDYSSVVPVGQSITTLTLGIASDDFQNTVFGQPYTATINGSAVPALTSMLNSLNETGPVVHFFTIGIDTSLLLPTNILTLSINEGGDGGDGWAVDFFTVGVTTQPSDTPEPASLVLMAIGSASLAGYRWRGRKSA